MITYRSSAYTYCNICNEMFIGTGYAMEEKASNMMAIENSKLLLLLHENSHEHEEGVNENLCYEKEIDLFIQQ